MTRDEAKAKAWADWHSGMKIDDMPPGNPLWDIAFNAGWAAAITMLSDRSGDLWSAAADAWAKRFVDQDAVEAVDRSIHEWGAE